MAAKRTIVIDFPTNDDGSLTHQIQNFGDDLLRNVEFPGLGDVGGFDAVDRATNRLIVRVSQKRKIGTVQSVVGKLLKQHFLDYRSKVTFR